MHEFGTCVIFVTMTILVVGGIAAVVTSFTPECPGVVGLLGLLMLVGGVAGLNSHSTARQVEKGDARWELADKADGSREWNLVSIPPETQPVERP